MTSEMLSRMYKLHYNIAYLYAVRLIGDEVSAHDIVMDSFIRIYDKYDDKQIKDRELKECGKGLVLFIVKNACYDHLRFIKRRRGHVPIVTDYLYTQSETYEEENDLFLVENHILNLILMRVENLTPRRSEIFKMYWKGFGTSNIAKKLNISRQTVLNQKANALQDLSIYLKSLK